MYVQIQDIQWDWGVYGISGVIDTHAGVSKILRHDNTMRSWLRYYRARRVSHSSWASGQTACNANTIASGFRTGNWYCEFPPKDHHCHICSRKSPLHVHQMYMYNYYRAHHTSKHFASALTIWDQGLTGLYMFWSTWIHVCLRANCSPKILSEEGKQWTEKQVYSCDFWIGTSQHLYTARATWHSV